MKLLIGLLCVGVIGAVVFSGKATGLQDSEFDQEAERRTRWYLDDCKADLEEPKSEHIIGIIQEIRRELRK